MKQTLVQEQFPIYTLKLDRDETPFASANAICDYFRACIEAHPSAIFIAEFDHLAHTRSLPEGRVGNGIRTAKNLIFCFGITLPNAASLALRPRSIGIAETDDGFVVTFVESPMPVANAAMEDWATRLRQTEAVPASVRCPGQAITQPITQPA